jgi:hypothetical protein
MAKKNKKSKWALLGAVAGLCAAPFTGGTSLTWTVAAASTGLGLAGGTVFGELVEGSSGDDNSGIIQAQQNYQAQMEQWKLLSEERRKDLENLRKDKEEIAEKIKSNDEEMDRLRAIINDPNRSEEDKNNARKKLVILEGENENLRSRLKDLESKVKEMENDKPPVPTTPSVPWKFPKLSAYDKLLATAVLVLIIYFLFLRNDRK